MTVLFSDPQEYHLGDQIVSGWPAAHGITWSQTFNIPHTVEEATLIIDVQGTEAEHNEVVVNTTNIGHLRHNPKSEYIASHHRIPHGVLRHGRNTIEIIVGFRDEQHRDRDDILIRNVRIIAGSHSGSGTGSGGKSHFFRGLRKNMEEKKGWKTVSVPGFDWAAISKHYAWDTLFACFDADSTSGILEGAHLKLAGWADEQGSSVPRIRMAIAVFEDVSDEKAKYITTKLQDGNRTEKQSMTAVFRLKQGDVFAPQEVGFFPINCIDFNKMTFNELMSVAKVLAKAH